MAPSITTFTPSSGACGEEVTITGSGFTGATSVTFNGVTALFVVDSDSQIRASVPPGEPSAITGLITVTASGSGSSATNFTGILRAIGPDYGIVLAVQPAEAIGPDYSFQLNTQPTNAIGPDYSFQLNVMPSMALGPDYGFVLDSEVIVPLLHGKQLRDQTVSTVKLADGVLSADAAGRLKMATSFFNNTTTVNDKFAAASISLTRLSEAVIEADGGQAFTANQSMGGFKLTSVGTPTTGTDAANKDYVDAVAAGIDWKASARLATAAALPSNTASGSGVGKTLTATANGALTVDGVTVVAADRILVKNEATGANNGIYVVTTVGSGGAPYVLTRATDADQAAEVSAGLAIWSTEGTANADKAWILVTDDPITIDTTALVFSQFNSSGTATLTTSNKNMSASTTTADNQAATATAIAATPAFDSYVFVFVNGLRIQVGDGTKVSVPCYFSGDGGTTARAITAIVSGDQLYWNGSIAGYELASGTDFIDFDYLV